MVKFRLLKCYDRIPGPHQPGDYWCPELYIFFARFGAYVPTNQGAPGSTRASVKETKEEPKEADASPIDKAESITSFRSSLDFGPNPGAELKRVQAMKVKKTSQDKEAKAQKARDANVDEKLAALAAQTSLAEQTSDKKFTKINKELATNRKEQKPRSRSAGALDGAL